MGRASGTAVEWAGGGRRCASIPRHIRRSNLASLPVALPAVALALLAACGDDGGGVVPDGAVDAGAGGDATAEDGGAQDACTAATNEDLCAAEGHCGRQMLVDSCGETRIADCPPCHDFEWSAPADADFGPADQRLVSSRRGQGISGQLRSVRVDDMECAFGPSGDLFLAWVKDPGTEEHATLWSGTLRAGAWETAVEPFIVSIDARHVRVAEGPGGSPWAFVATVLEGIAAYELDDGSWAERGVVLEQDRGWQLGDATLAPDGTAYVSWASSSEVRVRRLLSGSAEWEDLGSAVASVSDASGVGMAIDASGRPVVVWSDTPAGGSAQVYLRRWDEESGDWMEVDGSGSGGGVSGGPGEMPQILVGEDGLLRLVFADDGAVRVKELAGAAWVENAAGLAHEGLVEYDATLDAGGNLLIAKLEELETEERILSVHQLSSGSWQEVGTVTRPDGAFGSTLRDPCIRVLPDGRPALLWRIFGAQVFGVAFEDGATVPLGEETVSRAGLSANAGRSVAPSIAIDTDGNPVVAWQDDTSGNAEVFVSRFDGGQWRELDGSASGGGVSATDTDSTAPRIVFDREGLPVVVWAEQSTDSESMHVYAKRWNGAEWLEMSTGSASETGVVAGATAPPDVVVDGQGRVVIAYPASQSIGTRRFDGDAWSSAGTARFSLDEVREVAASADAAGDVLVVARVIEPPARLHGRRLTDAGWEEVPLVANGSFSPAAEDFRQGIDVAASSGGAWSVGYVGPTQLRPDFLAIFRMTSEGWVAEEIAGQVGLDVVGVPTLAVTPEGQVFVAWSGAAGAAFYDGQDWQVHGDGGVSNSAADSEDSDVAIGGGRVCVAWAERWDSAADIGVRCAALP